MSEQERYRAYDRFAWIYNQHWGGFAQLLMPILEVLLLNHLSKGARLLDLACGTGHITRYLVERGYQVTGLDGSQEMLRYARENAPEAELLLEDARHFSLPPIYQGALSTFDSLNHILDPEGLEAAFRNVYGALLPGGRFLFDLNLEAGYRAGWNGATGDSFADHAYIWKNDYDPDQKLATFEATLFRLEEGQWQRSDVTLYQRCYSPQAVFQALERAGFSQVKAYQVGEDLALVPLSEEAHRGFFVGNK